MEYVLTEEDRIAMTRMEALMREEQAVEEVKRKQVLAQVKELCSRRAFKDIEKEIRDCSYTHDYQIADVPLGTEQNDVASWGKHFVNQTTNGGYSGDDYAGTVSIPLKDGRYFQFSYSM
jgi:hypothetical protein